MEEKLNKEDIEANLGAIIEIVIGAKPNWDESELANLSADLPKTITNHLTDLNKNYKYSVVTIFFKKHQAPPKVNSSCLWDTDNDIYISICKDTPYYFCLANIYATYLNP